MELFRELLLNESEKATHKEAQYSIRVINDVYKEWKKLKRRINAVDLITTSINKITKIDPIILPYIHDDAKQKLAIILMRVMDGPVERDIETKKSVYKKVYSLLHALQSTNPNSGSGGNLREVIMTRLSTCVTHENDPAHKVFVGYEPSLSNAYLGYLFGDKLPQKIYKMQSLSLPEDYDTLVNVLRINYDKAAAKYKKELKSKSPDAD